MHREVLFPLNPENTPDTHGSCVNHMELDHRVRQQLIQVERRIIALLQHLLNIFRKQQEGK